MVTEAWYDVGRWGKTIFLFFRPKLSLVLLSASLWGSFCSSQSPKCCPFWELLGLSIIYRVSTFYVKCLEITINMIWRYTNKTELNWNMRGSGLPPDFQTKIRPFGLAAPALSWTLRRFCVSVNEFDQRFSGCVVRVWKVTSGPHHADQGWNLLQNSCVKTTIMSWTSLQTAEDLQA